MSDFWFSYPYVPSLPNGAAIKKKVIMVSKHTLMQISLYPWPTGQHICFHTEVKNLFFFFKLNAKKGEEIVTLNF
jgi:hypothetical protein